MNVMDLVRAADAEVVAKVYASSYSADGWADAEAYREFVRVLGDREPTTRLLDSGISVEISLRLADGTAYFSCDGRDAEGTVWALDLSPWSDWALLPVVDATGQSLSVDELAAHVYYEITWGGWPEQSEKRAAKIIADVEDLKLQLGITDEESEK